MSWLLHEAVARDLSSLARTSAKKFRLGSATVSVEVHDSNSCFSSHATMKNYLPAPARERTVGRKPAQQFREVPQQWNGERSHQRRARNES